jgi:hypothetical protein
MNNVVNINTNEVGELKGLLASAREMGLPVAIIRIPVRLFAIDPMYQTPNRTERDLRYLVSNFDERKLLPVTGVPHDEEGKVYLVDGYGRWQASQMVDPNKYETLPCMVILNAPVESKARQKFEAEQYAYQNVNVAKMRPIQKHGALEVLEDKAVIAMNMMQEKYGFLYAKDKGNRECGVLGSYAETYAIAKAYGIEGLDYIFSVCQNAGFDRKANGYATNIMRGLRDVYRYYPEHRKETAKFLSEYLRRFEPCKFKANAISRYLMLDPKTATSLYMEDLVVDNISLSHKRKVEGKSVSEIRSA